MREKEVTSGSVAVRGNLAHGCHTADNTVFPKLEVMIVVGTLREHPSVM